MTEFKLDRKQLEQIRKSPMVAAELKRRAELILAAIDHEGYEVVTGMGRTRARAAVIARSTYARRSNALHNTLIRHLGAGRG